MDTGAFHFFLDAIDREPLLVFSVVISVLIVLAFLVFAAVKPLRPIMVWSILLASFFGFSQMFPENRNQMLSLGIGDLVGSTLLTWYWCGRVAPGLRAKVREFRRAG